MTVDDASLSRAVGQAVADVLAENGQALPPGGGPLNLDSLLVVALVDALETRLPVRLRPQDVTAAHFASLASLTALCRSRQGGG
jgi:hypothetical protein